MLSNFFDHAAGKIISENGQKILNMEDKRKQKELISQLMKQDQEAGMYDVTIVDYVSPEAKQIVINQNPPSLIHDLRTKLDKITPEQITADFNSSREDKPFVVCEACGMEECKDTCQASDAKAYRKQYEYEEELMKERAIEFAKWLAKDWMSIWVVGYGWMWEWQNERTSETFKKYKEYYTEEELYELYLEEIDGK